MKPMFLCSLLCLLTMAFGAESAASQVTRADYERADTILKCSDRVYSPAIHPEWIDSSHYFWYKNHEKEGDFYYLVNAESGKKQRAADKKGLAAFFSKKQKKLAESLLKEEEKRPDRWRRREEAPVPVVSPDKKWEAYVKDNNLYLSPVRDEKEKDKPKEEIALTMDGTANLRYDGWSIIWSPDSRKLATVKVRDVQERRIPLIESSPSSQKQPILQWRNYAKPGDVLPVYLPVLFDVEARKQMALNVTPYENQFYLNLTGWREDSRAFTFEFNQRGHQRYVIGEVSAADGSIRHLVDEQTKTFIYYYNNYRYDLDDGKELLWISERDGWRHLYLIDGTSGQVKQQVTKGEWVVRQVDYVDETNRVVYFTASGFNKGEDPYNLHYCRINLDGTGFTDMTPENGNHRVTFSADRSYFTDVYSRPDLPPVSQLKRTSDASVVADMVTKELEGLSSQGVFGAVKHFPGQGGVSGDSHDGAVTLDKSLEELMQTELVPFQKAVENGVSFVMVGHISVPQVVGDNTPASLSQMMVSNVLREQLGYQGIVITDAMNMGAITGTYTADQAAVMAVNAGVDMILMPQDYETAYNGLLQAVQDGTITEERIDESVERIVKVKLQMQ